MPGDDSDLVSLLLSKADDKLKAKLKDLEGNHNLEHLLDALLKICKKSMLGAELKQCVVPFIKKHFGSLPTTKATSLVQELIRYTSKEYSIRTSVPLLKLLIETAQLGNASNLRRLVKTNVVSLQDRLRQDGFNHEADLILGCVSNVLLLELVLLDNVNPDEIEATWDSLQKPKEKPDIYLFASFLIHTGLSNQDEASKFEDEFCKNFQPDQSFVDYSMPYFHVVVSNFKPTNVILFLKQILKFYIEERKLDEFYECLFKVPELRNNQLPKFGNALLSSTLMVLWEKISKEKKRKAGDSGELSFEIKGLLEVLNTISFEFEFTVDFFKDFFSKCCKMFSKFVYNKEMKATSFVDCLLVIQNLIPTFDLEAKKFLISVMPFVLTCSGEEPKLVQILKIYSSLLTSIEQEFLTSISTDSHITEFLDVLIRRCSKNSNELRYQCGKFVSIFLHSDWTFLKGFIKGKKSEDFEALNSTFNKAIKAPKRLPKSEIATVFQTCLSVYEKETESIKSKNFKPEKGLGLLITSLTDLLKSIISASSDLSVQGPIVGGIIVDLVKIFIQLARLCKIAEIEVENTEVIVPVLKYLFDDENGFAIILESERTFVLNSLVENLMNFRIHVNQENFFSDVRRLFNLAKCPQCESQVLTKIVKQILLKQNNDWKKNLMKYFPSKNISENDKNTVFKLLIAILNAGKNNIDGLENYIFDLLIDSDAASTECMEFGSVYLISADNKKDFNDFSSIILLSTANALASQNLTKQYEVIVSEIKKSTAAITVIESLTKIQQKTLMNQIHIVGQMISKLIFNALIFGLIVACIVTRSLNFKHYRDRNKRRWNFDEVMQRETIIFSAEVVASTLSGCCIFLVSYLIFRIQRIQK